MMDISEEFEDESPCFIVPGSQASENGVQRNSETLLRGLAMLQPASNQLVARDSGSSVDIDYSSESVLPNSSSSEAQSHDKSSSLSSSKSDSSGEKQKAEKEHALRLTRSDRADRATPQNFYLTSTPMVQGNVFPCEKTNEQIAHLTPLEHVTKNSTSYTSQQAFKESKAKETSSSDETISPSLDLVLPESSISKAGKCEMMQDRVNLSTSAQRKTLYDKSMPTVQTEDGLVLLGPEKIEQVAYHKLQEKTTPTDTFQCLQFSGECITKETSSSDDVISQSSEILEPDSPSATQIDEVIHEKTSNDTEERMICDKEHPEDVNDDNTTARNESNLPQWQQQIMARPDRSSPVSGTLTRTTSSISTSNHEISSPESSLHQWQSVGNESDDMFETDHNTNHGSVPNANNENLQDHFNPKHPDLKGLSLPVLSQDIFQPTFKGVPRKQAMPEDVQHSEEDVERALVENIETNESAAEKQECRPNDVPHSQDFFLHLTQSQSSTAPSQTRSQPDRQTSLIDLDKRITMDIKENADLLRNFTPPRITLSSTILSQTPLGQPSTTGHHEDIVNPSDTGPVTRISVSSESDELTTTAVGNIAEKLQLTTETGVDSDILNESSESIESGLVCFHFSPPSMLLKPVTRTTPLCLKTSSEIVRDSSQGNISTTAFHPTSPDVATTLPEVEKSIPVATLSLSVPAPDDENTDEDRQELEFNLQKDVLAPDVDKSEISPTPPERFVFTKVRERFQPVKQSLPDDGIDPFEFRDEVYTSPMQKRKRNRQTGDESCNGQWSGIQKRTRVDSARDCGMSRGEEGEVQESNATKVYRSNQQGAMQKSRNERFWRIVRTRIITTTTTIIETETEVTYTTQNGVVISKETKHEFSEPTYETKTNENENRKEVDVIPSQIRFDEDVCGSHVETCKASGNKEVTTAKQSGSASSKHKRSVDKQRTSPRCSRSPRETLAVLHEGTRVLALWHDKHYYPGHVAFKCRNDAKYRIKFDDGNQTDIREQCIIVVEYLPCDQPVMFCLKSRGEYVEGVIRGFYRNGNERGYKVIGEDDKVVRRPRSDVILSAEQAAIFLSLRESKISEQNPSSESLENSPVSSNNDPCQNKVTKTTRRSYERGPKKSSEHFSNGSRPLTDKDTNTEQKRQEKAGKNKENDGNVLPEKESMAKKKAVGQRQRKRQNSSASETSKSSHKSTGKKASSSSKKGRVVDNSDKKDDDIHVNRVRRRLSTVMKSSPSATNHVPTRISPIKFGCRMDTVDNNENLILPTNTDLFRGFGFVLTGNDVRCPLGDENSPQEEAEVFIRREVCLQIRTGGGEVLNRFPHDYQSDSCFLLSNACRTTAKYFYALVLGVPCLSHAWVRDCCVENKLISFNNYLLPAGQDLIEERLIEKQNYANALRGLKVHLVGDDEFKQEWSEILKAAGCEVIPKLPTNILGKLQYGETDFACDVIVVGNSDMSHGTIGYIVQKARLLGIPTVTIQWVKQCILTGRRVDFYAHESFIYRVQR